VMVDLFYGLKLFTYIYEIEEVCISL
jgi:hypothetical protein